MKTADFDFDLPEDRIALRPADPRDSARLLVVDGDALQDRIIRDLPDFLRPGDALVFNDTRVIPARLSGVRQRIGSIIIQSLVPVNLPLPVVTLDAELETLLAQSLRVAGDAANEATINEAARLARSGRR